MCTRYVLLEEHYRKVLQRLGIASPAAFLSRYNIGPGAPAPVIRTRRGAAAEVAPLSWGWTPPWARGSVEKLVNIRAETVAQRSTLRDALRTRRCLVPASGFYEWQKLGSARQPFLFRRRDGQPFGLAALCPEPAPGAADGFAVITTAPNRVVAAIHDRMPVTLALDEMDGWVRHIEADETSLLARLRPATEEEFESVAVHRRMNNVRYDEPDCVEPVELRDAAGMQSDAANDGQFSLDL